MLAPWEPAGVASHADAPDVCGHVKRSERVVQNDEPESE
jgi:hypothetical protein